MPGARISGSMAKKCERKGKKIISDISLFNFSIEIEIVYNIGQITANQNENNCLVSNF